LQIFWEVDFALPIGGVIAERNILSRFAYLSRPVVKTSPVNLAVASGNGKQFFTQKLPVQMANNHRSKKSQTNTKPLQSF
jgi:hypothetical protein